MFTGPLFSQFACPGRVGKERAFSHVLERSTAQAAFLFWAETVGLGLGSMVPGAFMTKQLPRVTYSNIGADFGPLHEFIDVRLEQFRRDMLGRAWPNVVAGRQDVSGRAYEVYCPFDRELLVARLVEADR
jgi:hypothetical protein